MVLETAQGADCEAGVQKDLEFKIPEAVGLRATVPKVNSAQPLTFSVLICKKGIKTPTSHNGGVRTIECVA